MSTPNDGGQAFPTFVPVTGRGTCSYESGMTLRDWFAGQALAGLVANPEGNRNWFAHDWAHAAYESADAMLAARTKGQP